MEQLTMKKFMNEMQNLYTTRFNVYRDEKIGNIPLSFYAEFKRRDEKYLMTKTIKIWEVENQQYVFVKEQDGAVTIEDIQNFAQELDRNISSFVPDKQDHMSSYLVGVIVTNESVEKKVQKAVQRSRKIKFIKCGLHGWVDRYMAIVSLKDKCVYVQTKGREFVTGFEKVLAKEDSI
ncbi:hypothetical protein GN156_08475 [bacterium LRH843]|nr:hypothetical protein [bacterium LRH843]